MESHFRLLPPLRAGGRGIILAGSSRPKLPNGKATVLSSAGVRWVVNKIVESRGSGYLAIPEKAEPGGPETRCDSLPGCPVLLGATGSVMLAQPSPRLAHQLEIPLR